MSRTYTQQAFSRYQPVREITEGELLTWQIQFKREGTLPAEVQRRMLEHIIDKHPVAVGYRD